MAFEINFILASQTVKTGTTFKKGKILFLESTNVCTYQLHKLNGNYVLFPTRYLIGKHLQKYVLYSSDGSNYVRISIVR